MSALINQPTSSPTLLGSITQLAKFASKFKVDDSGCWVWQQSPSRSNGYGRFWLSRKKCVSAHRYSIEFIKGVDVSDRNKMVDHLCRVRMCVNPSHLELVTAQENLLRGDTLAASNSRKTHCSRGHELSGDNIKVTSNGRGCILCRRIRGKVYDRIRYNKKRGILHE